MARFEPMVVAALKCEPTTLRLISWSLEQPPRGADLAVVADWLATAEERWCITVGGIGGVVWMYTGYDTWACIDPLGHATAPATITPDDLAADGRRIDVLVPWRAGRASADSVPVAS